MKQITLLLIECYMKFISPAKRSCCRFVPTCSAYAYQAIERFGIAKGSFLAFCRILRCNPFSKGGFDPVPQKNQKK